jgi:hypothetical protein
MPAETVNALFLLEDLEDAARTRELAERELGALRAVGDWIDAFVAKPHKDLGRAGPVCPFVPGSLERKTLWLASEQIADRSGPAVVELMNGYIRRLLDAQPTDGADAEVQGHRRRLPRPAGGSRARRLRRRPPAADGPIVCGRWNPVRAVLRGQRGHRDLQLELPPIHIARAVPVRAAWGRQRLEVLPGQREMLNLWARRFGESAVPRACRGTTPPLAATGD